MPEALGPLLLPPTPPEASSIPQGFPQPIRGWMERMVDWLTQTIRVLKDTWAKLVSVLNTINAAITTIQATLVTIQANLTALLVRSKDIYTFTLVGSLAVGANVTQVVLVARVAGTLTEAFAYVGTAPTGVKIILDVNKNGATIFSGTKLEIADGAQTGVQTVFTSAVVQIGDVFTVDVDQIGSTVPGLDLTVHLSVK